MAIVRRKNGNFDVEIYLDGKRVATKRGFRNKSMAKEWQEETRSRYRVDPFKYSVRNDYSFEDLVSKYETVHLPKVREQTKQRYLLDIRYRLLPRFKFCKLKSITTEMILKLQTDLLENLKPKSVNNCISLLSAMLNFAITLNMLRENPCKVKALKIPVKAYNWWENWDNVQSFLQATTYRPLAPTFFNGGRDCYAAAYRLALECGLRLGEIVGLSKQDVDFDRCQIHIHRQWLVKLMEYGPTKHNRVRTIGFDPNSDLSWLLRDAIEASPDKDAIFLTPSGQRVRSDKLSGRYFQGWIKHLGLPKITFHDLRHTFASWFMMRGGDIWELMEILGHSSIKTTMRYAHLSSRVKRVPSFNPSPDDQITSFSRQSSRLKVVTS